MKVISTLLLSIISLTITTAQVDLSGKTRYYTNGLTDAFHLVDVITPVSHSYVPYADTSICISDACNNPSALVAYEISYPNQGVYHACFCDDAVFDISYMADNVGRVPYLVRKNVISYTAASIGQGAGAYAYAGKIAFFDQQENTEVFLHESAHVFDGSASLSSSSVYLNGISTDSCVPDDYASSNPVEDFAQLTVTWTYYVLTNTATPACLSNSINYLATVLPREAILSTYSTTPTTTPSTVAPTVTPTSSPTLPPTPGSCTIGVRQTMSQSWQSNGATYTQFEVVFTNNGAEATAITATLRNGQISQIWNFEQHKDGSYYLPSYQPTIAAGAQFIWGYIVIGTSPITISLYSPSSCDPSSSPATSAPVTSAPVTSAPVTSAPVTSAPVTSAPVTSAPVTSSCTFEIRQTLGSTWVNNGKTFSQFNVVYRNAGAKEAAAVVQLEGGVISQYWNLEQNSANGYYYLPSYQPTIAPNAEFSWGYIAETASALTIRLIC